MPQVELVRPLEVSAPGSSELKISNRGSNAIFYGDDASVSASHKTGTLGVGESLTIQGPLPVWLAAEAVPAIVDFQEKESGAGGTTVITEAVGTIVAAPTGQVATDTANVETAIAEVVGTLRFRAGTYVIDHAVIGSLTSGKGKQLRIVGAGAGATILKPGGAGRVLDIKGPGDSTSQYLVISDLTIEGAATDYAYSEPLLQITGFTNWRLERFRGTMTGTGTFLKLDSCFNGSAVQAKMLMGRYAVPLEYDDSAGGSPQVDTVKLEQFVSSGNFGAIFRQIANGMHTLRFDGYKTVIESGEPDREVRAVGKLNKEAAAGSETIELEAGQGASYAANDPVFIGASEKADPNKVTEVAGDVLKLRWPTRYAHNPAEGTGFQGQVLSHGVALSIPNNLQLLDLESVHLEGAATAVLIDGAVNVTVNNCLYVAQDFLWLVGALQDLTIRAVHAQGSSKELVNHIVTVPAANTAGIARLKIEGPITFTAGQPTPVPFYDPGENLPAKVTTLVENQSGVPRKTYNVPTGSRESVLERTTVNGVVTHSRTYGGVQTILTESIGLTITQSAAAVKSSPGIRFTDGQEPAQKVTLLKTDSQKLGLQDNSNAVQMKFDMGTPKVIFGSAEDSSFGRISEKLLGSTDAAVRIAKGLGLWGEAPPAAQHAAIANPAEELKAVREKLEEVIAVLKEYRLTK